jgi:hypothetical protein
MTTSAFSMLSFVSSIRSAISSTDISYSVNIGACGGEGLDDSIFLHEIARLDKLVVIIDAQYAMRRKSGEHPTPTPLGLFVLRLHWDICIASHTRRQTF